MENTKFVQDLQKQVHYFKVKQNFSGIVILCIGTNKLIGDSLGPIVGQKLTDRLRNYKNITIYGNMKETLNFRNAKQVLEQVITTWDNPFIIGIDSALGKAELINEIVVGTGKIQLGNALGKNLKYPTHIHIKGVVGINRNSRQENMKVLESIQDRDIHKISENITQGVCKILETV